MKNKAVRCVFLLIVSVGLFGINACQQASHTPASIWKPAINPEHIAFTQWLSERWPSHSDTIELVNLWLTKVYGFDSTTAFLLGSYQLPSLTYRSLLLRTDDGGQTWHEVHKGIREATLFGITFVKHKTGYAYGQMTTGDPGLPFILHSDDGGLSWTQVSQVTGEGSPAIYAFQFTNAHRGQIKLLFHAVGTTPDASHRIETHETIDGGHTWQQIESKMVADDAANQLGDLMEADIQHLHNNIGWQIEEAEGDAWTHGYWVARSIDSGQSWQRVSRFVRHPFAGR